MITVGFRGGGGGQGPETLASLCNFLLACVGRGASLVHHSVRRPIVLEHADLPGPAGGPWPAAGLARQC